MEDNHNQPNTFRDRVLEKIQTGNVAMRSRGFFMLHVAALVVVATLVLVVSVLICNFILFSVRISGYGPLVGFGPRGFLDFLRHFPRLLLLVDIALVGLLGWLLRKFRFGYHRPLLYLFLGLLMLTVAVSLLVDRGTGINDELLRRADMHDLPGPFDGIFEGARHQPDPGEGICRCLITAIDGNTLTAEDTNSSTTLKLVIPPGDPQLGSLKVGDIVFVAGDPVDGTINTYGVRRLPPKKE